MSNDEPQTLWDVANAAVLRNGGARGRGLKRVAEQKGLTLSYTTVDKILDGTYKSTPTRKTLEALAKLSGYRIEQVYRAARLPLPLKPLRDDLPADADLLDGPQRRVVIDTIRLFAQQNKALAALRDELDEGGGAHAGSAAPNTPADSGPHLKAVATGGGETPGETAAADEEAARARKKMQQDIDEMNRKTKGEGE